MLKKLLKSLHRDQKGIIKAGGMRGITIIPSGELLPPHHWLQGFPPWFFPLIPASQRMM